ncbi:putative ankyrin repeat domain-containing protein 19 isoform X10 [Rattus norvegicus]|uniref:YME1-like 1 ATPase n=1 Tax=Rattus norvegicus TaxID=10116 RepID=E9PT17_RAT|nr:putative ankyrin repeat domain-containing protein 19 isoform X10 [Rattus norvegicus]|eukprot:XP_003751779.1 PREDICTED: putative ankyrin repeat domain-containing protein 19 isoform X7 [Rattus norvegicus]
MGGKCSRGGERRPLGFPGFSALCCCQIKSREETPLGFCDIKARRNNSCFGREDPAYLDMAYFPDNDLHMAACAGDLPFMRLYFTLGKYEVNHRDRENRNAMHFACFYGHLELVIYLWRRGCEINVCDNHNITPLMKDNLTPLLLALKENRLKMAQFLVRMEASVHAVDSQRRNSLMYAVRCDCPVMVNLILQQGADINLKDLFGWTALRYAIEGDRDVRTILLEYEYNLIQRLRERNQEFQSSEDSSIRPINEVDAEVTSSMAIEKVIELQDPLTTSETSVKKIQTCRSESELEVISLEDEISGKETINNPQQQCCKF